MYLKKFILRFVLVFFALYIMGFISLIFFSGQKLKGYRVPSSLADVTVYNFGEKGQYFESDRLGHILFYPLIRGPAQWFGYYHKWEIDYIWKSNPPVRFARLLEDRLEGTGQYQEWELYAWENRVQHWYDYYGRPEEFVDECAYVEQIWEAYRARFK